MRLNEFFARHPVFTVHEMANFLAKRGSESRWTRYALLTHHLKRGHILRVCRGLYAVVPPGADPNSSPVDSFLLAAKMTDDAILAYHTALEFHGRSYSTHERFLYLTSSRSRTERPVTFRSSRLRGVLFPKKLRDKKQENFGVVIAERAGVDVRVTSLERTLVDVLDRPNFGGGWEEIWRSLESVEFFDLNQVVDYVFLLENGTTAAKVGFYLEQHRDVLGVDDIFFKRLSKCRPKNPHYMIRGDRKSGHFMAGWNLVVPDAVFRRSWQEII